MTRHGVMTIGGLRWLFGTATVLLVGQAGATVVQPEIEKDIIHTLWPYALSIIGALLAMIWWGLRDLKKTIVSRLDELEEKNQDHNSRIAVVETVLEERAHVPFVSTPPQTPTHGLATSVSQLTESVGELHAMVAGLMERESALRKLVSRYMSSSEDGDSARSSA